jgi:hypothetical protein
MEKQGHIITFQTYYDPVLAHIVRARLEANGIDCFVSDENTLVAQPFYNQAVGGVKLNIFESDLERCKAILAEDADLNE